MSNFVIRAVPADGLAPPGARASAGTVLTLFKYSIYTRLDLESWSLHHELGFLFNSNKY